MLSQGRPRRLTGDAQRPHHQYAVRRHPVYLWTSTQERTLELYSDAKPRLNQSEDDGRLFRCEIKQRPSCLSPSWSNSPPASPTSMLPTYRAATAEHKWAFFYLARSALLMRIGSTLKMGGAGGARQVWDVRGRFFISHRYSFALVWVPLKRRTKVGPPQAPRHWSTERPHAALVDRTPATAMS